MTSPLFKPMLAAKPDPDAIDEELARLPFPALYSDKLDGIRCTVQNGKLYSRTLKLIPNEAMQSKWGRAKLNGLDGEIIVGDPTAEDCFNRTTSAVMSRDKPMTDAAFHVFDKYHPTDAFIVRHNRLKVFVEGAPVALVKHTMLRGSEELTEFERCALTKGQGFLEGVMRRDPAGRYKQGRSTLREGGLVAVKRVVDAEAFVLGVEEQERNENEQTVDELGRAKRSAHKAGKVGKGVLGNFLVRMHGVEGGPEFSIGTGVGLTDAVRRALWEGRDGLYGKIIKFRYQKVGTVESPRQPIFLGFRDESDL